MTSTLVGLIVFCLIVGLVLWMVRSLPLPAPFGNIAVVLVVVLALIWLVERFGGLAGARL